ncbi:MAG: Ig-like domain-containing protein [Clostridia bacterium]|nr:Ig-like domain-containing protein [Clostridia bacterium]
MHSFFRRTAAFLTALILLFSGAYALTNEERTALFTQALEGLKTPVQIASETGVFNLHTGDSAYVPCVSPGIVPFDEIGEAGLLPVKSGTFSSSDESVVTVSTDGLATGVAPGQAELTCTTEDGQFTYQVTVGDDQLPQVIQNYIHVLQREFYSVKRAKLPKYNKYAKWYYGRRKEVGWCAVFTIYCANAAGTDPLTLKQINYDDPPMVQFVEQGQVGHQWDGYRDMGRFVSVPKPGYLVIYADMSNGYRATHIGSVADVQDLGDGLYAVTTIEGNMSNSVKSYCFQYDSNKPNIMVGTEKGLKLRENMAELPADMQVDPLVQYDLHTDHWSVFGFCQTWE